MADSHAYLGNLLTDLDRDPERLRVLARYGLRR